MFSKRICRKNILSITTVEDPLESTYWLSTVVVGGDHGLLKDATVISISGVSEVIYNAVFRVQEVGDTYIKDSMNEFRGTLRGIKYLYGTGPLPDGLILEKGNSLILNTKMFNWNSNQDEAIPYLFNLKDWEAV